MSNSISPKTGDTPRLYRTNSRQACSDANLPRTGKYWGHRFGEWARVEVTELPRDGGTGCLVFAPRDRRGYPWHKSGALQNCQALWGPVTTWGTKPPRVPKTQLKAIGVL